MYDEQIICCRLFVDRQKLSDEVLSHLKTEEMSVTILSYVAIATHVASLVGQAEGGTGKIWVSFCCVVFRAVTNLTHC